MVRFQLVIDCASPDRLARFWKQALHYEFRAAPHGYASWDDYYRALGVPDEDLGLGEDRLTDPHGGGPDIWFQKVGDIKIVKNRLHLDINSTGGIGQDVPGLSERHACGPRRSGWPASARPSSANWRSRASIISGSR
jgi:hypothetical protein